MSAKTCDTLSDILRAAANEAGLSARRIAQRASDAGYAMNHDTATRYLKGDSTRPREATLEAFAHVLDVPLMRLRAAANLPVGLDEPYVLPKESSRLNARQRRAVDDVIRAMLN